MATTPLVEIGRPPPAGPTLVESSANGFPPPVEIDVYSQELVYSPTERDNDPRFEEEINVYSIPHSRMKRLAQMAAEKLKATNCSNASELLTTLKTLSRVFYEFKTHERIENECIMRRLRAKLDKLNIKNTAVCNCHKDDELSVMLKLFSEGMSTKTESERVKYGLKLEKELIKFQQHFFPHMQEEEDIFQPLLVKYFTVDELKELKESVLKQHQMWNTMDNLEDLVAQYEDFPWTKSTKSTLSTYSSTTTNSIKTGSGTSSSSLHLTKLFDEKSNADIESLYFDYVDESQNPGCGFVTTNSLIEDKIIIDRLSGKCSPSPLRLQSPTKTTSSSQQQQQQNFPFINVLPSEILAKIFTYLTISDLCRVSQVCRQWNAVALDANLWLTLAPLVWISSLKDEATRDASWPNFNNLETDSQLSLSMSAPRGAHVIEGFIPAESEDSDSTGQGSSSSRVAPSVSGSSLVSNSGFKREQSAIASIAYRLVPRIGTRVTKLILAGSRSITNLLLRKILHYIPNVTYLDVRDTRIGDHAFKSLNRHDLKTSSSSAVIADNEEIGLCLGRLRYLNLSGCVNFTDEGLRLLLATLDGALGRLEDATGELSMSSCSECRFSDDVSLKSGQTGGRSERSGHHFSDANFQGLVITDDQMRQMRRQQQQQQQPQQQQRRRRKSSTTTTTKERKETLGSSGGSSLSRNSCRDLECSGDSTTPRSGCSSCVACPVYAIQSPAVPEELGLAELDHGELDSGESGQVELGRVELGRRPSTVSNCEGTTEKVFGANFEEGEEEEVDDDDDDDDDVYPREASVMASAAGMASAEAAMAADVSPPLLTRPLEYISLSGCYRLTDDGLWYLTRGTDRVEGGLPNLRHLDLSGCMNVSVEGLLPLLETCPLINFSHLFYCDNVFLGDGIDNFASGCRNLQRGGNRVCCRSGL